MSEQLWAVSSLGGYLSSQVLSQEMRHAAQPLMRFRQFCDPEKAIGKRKGDTVLFDKISNITTAGGTLSETGTIPRRNFTIKQGSLSVVEYGNAIAHTLKAETLAELSLPEAVKTVLRNDLAKTLDSAAAAQFKTSVYKAAVVNTATTTFSTSGTASATAGASMSDKNVRDIIDQMKKLNIPRLADGKYVAIASTNSIRGLYDFFEAKVLETSMAPLYTGEVGTYYGCRFVEETNILSNILGSGTVMGEAVFFGDDAVREGIVIPEEIRVDTPRDFGRDLATAWYYLGGFKIVWDYSTDTETRIIHVSSL